MPGRKKGRQRGTSRSKGQSARTWNDVMRDAREDLASDRRTKFVRAGDSAPPRLSVQGVRSLATLLHQRVRADQQQLMAPVSSPARASMLAASVPPKSEIKTCAKEFRDQRPRRTRSLVALCVEQIGRDFLEYREEDYAVAQAFLLLPSPLKSRISRAASAARAVADHNIRLLCGPGVTALWLRGRFTDRGAGALLPVLRGIEEAAEAFPIAQDVADIGEAYREGPSVARTKGGNAESNSACSSVASPAADTEVGNQDARDVEDWETADDRMEACLQGGVSLTLLELNSPLITADFVSSLALRIPSLQRLGLRSCLTVVDGPDAVCDQVLRLSALRELDLSDCTWFCDLCLRRLSKCLSRGGASACVQDKVDSITASRDSHWMINEDDAGAGDWGAASASGAHLGSQAYSRLGESGTGVSVSSAAVIETGGGVLGADVLAGTGGEDSVRFRTFTLICSGTSVTPNGARAAESFAPGLMVALDRSGGFGHALQLP